MFSCYNTIAIFFRESCHMLIDHGAKKDILVDFPKSELRAFMGQLPKNKGQHELIEKQYLQSYRNQGRMCKKLLHIMFIK